MYNRERVNHKLQIILLFIINDVFFNMLKETFNINEISYDCYCLKLPLGCHTLNTGKTYRYMDLPRKCVEFV